MTTNCAAKPNCFGESKELGCARYWALGVSSSYSPTLLVCHRRRRHYIDSILSRTQAPPVFLERLTALHREQGVGAARCGVSPSYSNPSCVPPKTQTLHIVASIVSSLSPETLSSLVEVISAEYFVNHAKGGIGDSRLGLYSQSFRRGLELELRSGKSQVESISFQKI